jgi:hypothetical protein
VRLSLTILTTSRTLFSKVGCMQPVNIRDLRKYNSLGCVGVWALHWDFKNYFDNLITYTVWYVSLSDFAFNLLFQAFNRQTV